MQGITKCYCAYSAPSKILDGFCNSCFGRLGLDKDSRCQTPNPGLKPENLEDFIRLKSEISEKAYMQTIKVMNLLKSTSGPFLPDRLHHKRSITSNKPDSIHYIIPEERTGIRKINHLHTESHPNAKVHNISKLGVSKSQSNNLEISKIQNLDKNKLLSFKTIGSIHHDRALSSKVTNIPMSPINSARFPSISEYPEAILRKSEELPKYMSNEFIHVGHTNSINSIALLQGRIFTAGHDYNIISWPRLDPKYQVNMAKINPHSIQRAHSRRINALETLGGRILISAGCQKKILIWSLSRDLELTSIIDSQEQNTNTLLATSQKTLISAGSEGIIKVWDIESRLLSKYYPEHDKSINSVVQINPSVFLSGSDDCTVKLCDLRTSKSICTYMHNGSVTSLISWDDKSFFSASEKLRVKYI